jgi:hypothetical protein
MSMHAMTYRQDEDVLEPARLASVGPCPARPDYLELRFTTADGEWEWCFPDPATGPDQPEPHLAHAAPRLALVMGPYGVQAHLLGPDDTLGYSLLTATAVPMIRSGAEVRVSRRLLRR